MHATALRHLAPGISATIQPPPRTSTPPISTFFSRLPSPSVRDWARVTNAASISLSVLAFQNTKLPIDNACPFLHVTQ